MECPLPPLPQEAAALLSMAEKQGLSLAFEENRVLLSGPGGRPLGSCRITSAGGQACLSSLMIEEARRGEGLGSCFLGLLLPALANQGFSRLVLQVSGSNLPALALYKKAGFRITETLLYYLY